MTPDHRAAARRLVAAASAGELDSLCEEFGVRLLALFGSADIGSAEGGGEPTQPARDLDVAVAFRSGSPGDLFAFVARLAAAVGPANVDPLDLDAAEPVVRAEALSGTPLYEAAPGAFAEAHIAALLTRWDTAWLRRLELERLAEDPPATAR